MTKLLPIMLTVFTFSTFAAAPPNMEAIAKCMQNIDESTFDKFEQEGNKAESQVKKLCANGKRDQAQKTALEYSRKIINSDEMKQVKKCGELMRGMIPEMKMPYDNFEEEFKNKHICDEI